MLIKCSTCGSRISKKWLFLGLPWSKYTCAQCGSVFAGTILRFILNTIAVGVVGFFVIRVLKGKTTLLFLLPMIGLTLVLLLFNLPWQIKKVGEEAGSEDKRTLSSRMKLSKIAALLMGIAIAAVIGEWAGEDMVGTPPFVFSILNKPWLVALLVILVLVWCGLGRSAQRFLGRLGITVILASALVLGLLWGNHVGTLAFNECVTRGEEVRKALAYYRATHGRYPTTLAELQLQNLPGDRLLRGNILSYDSDGDSYRLHFRDWLIRHDATDESPFIATK